MSIEVKQLKKAVANLVVAGEMTIYTALEQKTVFSKCLDHNKELQIDLSAVSEIDSAGLQLLLLLKREANQRHIKLSLINHSQAVVEVFELLNLGNHFGDPIVLSANWKST
ncbi:STAS domain-containing protein [Methylomonas sp. SURF-2]|uniref:STAS domain-containing protein n=1 Tax=Methylomonas subterranea TaxID=2952225 RepID=A0ABT1TH74_9GAMM|nr:STAS domain-containing protein [Methylomonas sp. SURF-2]